MSDSASASPSEKKRSYRRRIRELTGIPYIKGLIGIEYGSWRELLEMIENEVDPETIESHHADICKIIKELRVGAGSVHYPVDWPPCMIKAGILPRANTMLLEVQLRPAAHLMRLVGVLRSPLLRRLNPQRTPIWIIRMGPRLNANGATVIFSTRA